MDPPLLPLLTPAPVVAPLAEAVAEAAAATVLAPLAMILALILGSSTPAGGPGIPQHFPPPANRDELRLRELVAHHAAGTLTADEEAELIALLAKVKGVYIQRLSDLHVQAPLRGNAVTLPGFYNVPLAYTKRSTADLAALRNKFNSSARKDFLKQIGSDPAMVQQLKKVGFTDTEVHLIAQGKLPNRQWQVHHKLPLDDGGDNSFGNLMLIENDPYIRPLPIYKMALPTECSREKHAFFNGQFTQVSFTLINCNDESGPMPTTRRN